MMGETKIEWASHTWNPISGCTKISTGCQNCYAERMSKRLAGRCGYPLDDPFKVTLHPEKLEQPLHWTKPRKIFVNSMSDLFHDDVPDEFIARVWWVMGQCAGYLDHSRYKGHTFMILTKRSERMREWLRGWADQEKRKQWVESFGEIYDWQSGPKYWPDVLNNVWLGVSVENQAAVDERIPLLLQTPAAVRFISAEPLLGPIVLKRKAVDEHEVIQATLIGDLDEYSRAVERGIDWVIAGGESGLKARPMHPDWVRSLRDQCQAAEVPFFFKQFGEFIQVGECMNESDDTKFYNAKNVQRLNLNGGMRYHGAGAIYVKRVGKKAAGRELDGREWSETPS